jgi:hypothetical protein
MLFNSENLIDSRDSISPALLLVASARWVVPDELCCQFKDCPHIYLTENQDSQHRIEVG